jgi:uncharacterized protein (DUF1684 family)
MSKALSIARSHVELHLHWVCYQAVRVALASLVIASCLDGAWPPPVSFDQFSAEHGEWRQDRRERLITPPSGPVLWIGLWQLPQGSTEFGSDPGLPIVLPSADAPSLAGTLHRSGQDIRLEAAAASSFRFEDGSIVTEPVILGNDRSDDVIQVALGALGMRIHAEPGTDRLWLRVWNEDHPQRETFVLPETFPLDVQWRVSAHFEPYPEPRVLPVADVTSGSLEYETPGELVFDIDGEEHRLIAIAGAESTRYFVMMWDSTAISQTYPGGRYITVPLADADGRTIIDFNRAYNAPCVFTPYSVCGLPPPDNYLPLHVTSGEKRPQ